MREVRKIVRILMAVALTASSLSYGDTTGYYNWLNIGGFPGANGTVTCVAFVDSSAFYFGGCFDSAGGSRAKNVAQWNGAEWVALGNGVNVGADTAVLSMALDKNNKLFVTGRFDTAGTLPAQGFAVWNGTAWSSIPLSDSGVVNAVCADAKGNVYAGGRFTTINGLAAKSVAVWNGSNWSPLGTGTTSTIVQLVFDNRGSKLYGVQQATFGTFVAVWDGSTWTNIGTGSMKGHSALTIDKSGNLYAAGDQSGAGPANTRIGKWNGSNWNTFHDFTWFQDQVNSLCWDSSGNLWVGGNFSHSNKTAAMKWNGSTWSKTSLSGNEDVYVFAVRPAGGLLLGGNLGIKVLVDTSWVRIGGGVPNSVSSLGDDHHSLQVVACDNSGHVYAGWGEYRGTAPKHAYRSRVWEWDGSLWKSLGGELTGNITSLSVNHHGDLFAGLESSFNDIGVYRWNGLVWAPVGILPNGANYLCFDQNDSLYVQSSIFIDKWTGTQWQRIEPFYKNGGAGRGVAFDTSDQMFVVDNDSVFVKEDTRWVPFQPWPFVVNDKRTFLAHAVRFDARNNMYVLGIDGNTKYCIRKWDGSTWTYLGRFNGGSTITIKVFQSSLPDGLYVSGDFTSVSDSSGLSPLSLNGLITWDGMAWNSAGVDCSTNGSVDAVAFDSSGTLYIGGSFSNAGGLKYSSFAVRSYAKIPASAKRPAVIPAQARRSPMCRIANAMLRFDGLGSDSRIQIYSLSGRCLREAHGVSVVNLKGVATQSLVVRIAQSGKVVSTGMFMLR